MAIPKYEQIKNELLLEIKNHKFFPGEKFYSEADLKNKYNVSSITAVRVLNEMTSAGYLYRIQGKGTFVSKSKIEKNVSFSDIENHTLDAEKVKVISIEKEYDKTILKELGLTENDCYYVIKRVRFAHDIPFFLHISHLPLSLVKEPVGSELTKFSSVYERIRKDFQIDLHSLSSVETNEIVFPEGGEILNFLHVSFREPVVKQVKHTYLEDGSVAEYIVSYKHWKYFKTKIDVAAE